ncbi:MAG: hypothetical protein ICV66_00340 [Chitinophagaceae bacterium]|nr:hypothetical protein [Chitinophagaceae bacterium]
MDRRTFSLLLVIIAILSIAYAVYRSTAERITIQEGTKQTVYGEPQHGLVLGLCILAGLCLIGIVLLFRDNRIEVNQEQPRNFTPTRTATNYPQ